MYHIIYVSYNKCIISYMYHIILHHIISIEKISPRLRLRQFPMIRDFYHTKSTPVGRSYSWVCHCPKDEENSWDEPQQGICRLLSPERRALAAPSQSVVSFKHQTRHGQGGGNPGQFWGNLVVECQVRLSFRLGRGTAFPGGLHSFLGVLGQALPHQAKAFWLYWLDQNFSNLIYFNYEQCHWNWLMITYWGFDTFYKAVTALEDS